MSLFGKMPISCIGKYQTAGFAIGSIYFQVFCVVFLPQLHHATALRMIVHCIQCCSATILPADNPTVAPKQQPPPRCFRATVAVAPQSIGQFTCD
jgi:hypothetical protein